MTRHLATLRALLSPEPTGVKTISQPGFNPSHRYIVVEPDPLPLGLGVGCGSLQCQIRLYYRTPKDFHPGLVGGPFRSFPRNWAMSGGENPPHIQTYDPLNSRVIVTPAVYPRLFEFLHFDLEHFISTDSFPKEGFPRLTFRALGRNHIASTPLSGHRNAMF